MAGQGGVIGTILGWVGYQLGMRADAASATGSLHAKAADIKSYLTSKVNNIPGDVWGYGSRGPSATVAGNTVRLSANAERGGTSIYYKRIKVNVTGMVRAKFELKGEGRATLSYIIAELETSERFYTVDVDNSSYTSYSRDFSVCAGDVVSLRISPEDEWTMYMRNFQLCWEYSSAPVTGRVLVD